MNLDNNQNITPNLPLPQLSLKNTVSEENKALQENDEAPEFPKRKAEFVLDGYQDISKKTKSIDGPKFNPENNSIAHLLRWRDELQPMVPQSDLQSYKKISVPNIVNSKLDEIADNFQAIFLNINWKNEKNQTGLSIEQFKKLQLSDKLISNGMVFVWADKQNMNQVMDHLETLGIFYVQIFTFVLISIQKLQQQEGTEKKNVKKERTILDFFKKKQLQQDKKTEIIKPALDYYKITSTSFPNIDPKNVIANQNYSFFNKGKKNLLMLRKINKKQSLQLRHQRTSDVFFTLYNEETQEIDSKGYECVYKMIETLLIRANYTKNQNLKMLQLWANRETARKGWISISESQKI